MIVRFVVDIDRQDITICLSHPDVPDLMYPVIVLRVRPLRGFHEEYLNAVRELSTEVPGAFIRAFE